MRYLVFGLLPSSAVTLSDHTQMDINTKTIGKCFLSILDTFCLYNIFGCNNSAQFFLNLVAENIP